MSEFLTDEDLIQLTGCVQRAKQIEVLKHNRIRYFERFDGKPVVAKEAIAYAVRGEAPGTDFDDGFNLDALQQH
ncbi:DUF4224 domain-containing protein [Oceanobacter mangrovi]|uniref:DUF4224 domain-containing protein n=1 Tax=Oceanobacter mangrovi TaxID=2862510 RepID=UPI001C8EE761|nr:DUF4224 domain-containing protein [Oceanobacter mangrovi]